MAKMIHPQLSSFNVELFDNTESINISKDSYTCDCNVIFPNIKYGKAVVKECDFG